MFKRINCHLTGHKKALWAWGTKPYNTAPHFISIGSRGDASIGLLQLPQGKSSETDNKSIDCHRLAILNTWLSGQCSSCFEWLAWSFLKEKTMWVVFFLITNGINAAAAPAVFSRFRSWNKTQLNGKRIQSDLLVTACQTDGVERLGLNHDCDMNVSFIQFYVSVRV